MQYYRKTSVREQVRQKNRQEQQGMPARSSRDASDRYRAQGTARQSASGQAPSSASKKKRRRIRVKKRFFVFLALFLTLVVLACVGISALFKRIFSGYYVVDYGMIESTNKASALLLRDEIVVRSEGYGTVEYIASDLANVSTGDPVLDFYSSGYTEDIRSELTQVNNRIEQQQASSLAGALSGIVDDNLIQYDAKIEEKTQQIRDGLTSGDLAALYTELNQLLDEKQAYLEQTSTAQADTMLTQLYATKSQLLGRIQGWKSAYSAPNDGRVSYSFDGFEPYLTTEVLDLLSAQNVRDLIANKDPEQPAELRSQQNLYRIVDPNHWYAMLLTADTQWTVGVGEKCALYFEGYEDLSFQATVSAISGSQTELMVVLEMNEDIGPLINARKLSAVIGGRVEGMRVPLKSIVTSGGQQGVHLYETGAFVPVRVIGHDNKYALVLPEEDGALQKDMRIKK